MNDKIKKTILLIANKLKDKQYAIRGTVSLVMQGIEMNIADVDVLCDKTTALYCNKAFKKYLVSEVEYSESDKFKSYFGYFDFEGVQVEVMGDWQIKNPKGNWSEPFSAAKNEIEETILDSKKVKTTKIETELAMFAQMGRWNAYHKIKKQFEGKSQTNLL